MFKPGQLIRFEDFLLQVRDWPICKIRRCNDPMLKDVTMVVPDEPSIFTLIGNNYRPLAPGAKAKRRYNETAAKVVRGEAGYQPAVKSPLSKSCGDKFGDMPKLR